MPHLRIRGLNKEKLIELSAGLLEDLSKAMDSDKSTFTLEHIPSVYISEGRENTAKHIFVEMLWFDRGYDTKEMIADIITRVLSKDDGRDVALYFIDMKKENYFKNGVHF